MKSSLVIDSESIQAVKSTTNKLFIYVLKILKKLILAHFSKSKNMSSLEPIVGLSIPYLQVPEKNLDCLRGM